MNSIEKLKREDDKKRAAYYLRRDRLRDLNDRLHDEVVRLLDANAFEPGQILQAKKIIATELNDLEVGLHELGKKMVKAETNNYLTFIFDKKREEIEAMPAPARELYEGMRIAAAKALGNSGD